MMSRRLKGPKAHSTRSPRPRYPGNKLAIQTPSTSSTSISKVKEWQRCSEGFHLIDAGSDNKSLYGTVKKHPDSDSKYATSAPGSSSKQHTNFGQKWIQSEPFQVISHPSQKFKYCGSDSDPIRKTTDRVGLSFVKDTEADSICWKDSDSDSEVISTKQNIAPPAKRLRTKCHTKGSKLKSDSRYDLKPKHASCGLVSDSDDEVISTSSGSDEEKVGPAETVGSSALPMHGSPYLHIECVGSPDHSPSQTADEEQVGNQQDEGAATHSRKVHIQAAGSSKGNPASQETTCISSCTSSQTAADSDMSPGQRGLRISEWTKQVKWDTTPTKNQSSPPAHAGDSTKRKKKFTKGGLAEQMSRILLREKSSTRMWQHQQTLDDSQGSKSMTLRVIRVRTLYSVSVADCSVVCQSSSLKPSSSSRCLVFFSRVSTKHPAALQPEACVQIYTPWQELVIPNGQQVLLCMRYYVTKPSTALELLEAADYTSSAILTSPTATGHGRWLCPCSMEAGLKPARCPANLFPFLPSSIAQKACSNQCDEEPRTTGKMLYTVKSNSSTSRRMLIYDSLLEAMEKAQTGDKLLPVFQATVLRVFCEQLDTGCCRYSILLEDSQGTVAVISCPDPIGNIEGCLCCFSCLRVQNRTNTDRDPRLFSAITGAWSDRVRSKTTNMESSIETFSGSSDMSQFTVQAPGFCYLLEVDRCALDSCADDNWLTVVTERTMDIPLRLAVSTLAQLLKCQELQNRRVSFVGQIVYHSVKPTAKDGSQNSTSDADSSTETGVLYIIDHTLQADMSSYSEQGTDGSDCSVLRTHTKQNSHNGPAYIEVKVYKECVIDSLFHGTERMRSTDPHVLLMRDIWVVEGTWIADRYSRLFTCGEGDQGPTAGGHGLEPDLINCITQITAHFPPVSASSQADSLVSLSGVIERVDEKTAVSWEECDGCGSEQLATRTSLGSLECLSCSKMVHCPVQRMKMEVDVEADCSSSVTVHVSLQQSTIEGLLPDEEDDEGYDVDCVLQKRLNDINCVITSAVTTATGIHMTAIQLSC